MYEHDFSELNKYTGLFSALCFLCLAGCYWAIAVVGRTIEEFRDDYRKVNQLDEREEWESKV